MIDLFGHVGGEPFTTSDQKLLSAIASQVGAALENNRLIQESLKQERMSHEMELAQNLQMKLLSSPEAFDRADVAARVMSAEQGRWGLLPSLQPTVGEDRCDDR